MATVEEDLVARGVGIEPTGPMRSKNAVVEAPQSGVISGVLTGVLIGFGADSQTPLVLFPGQPGNAAIRAGSVVDLHGSHIGRQIVLMFENGDARQPVILGLLRQPVPWSSAETKDLIEVDADGERVVVTAREKLVLRCGKASITLTKAGKVLIEGEYLSSRSSGVNRIKGGSIQLN